MSYITLPVPEEHVPAVYELLASLSRGTTPPTPSSREETNPDNDEWDDGKLRYLVSRVMEDTRTVLRTLARMPNTEIDYPNLEREAGLNNLGSALQSLGIRCKQMGLGWPFDAQHRDGKVVYSMDEQTAERILSILDGDA